MWGVVLEKVELVAAKFSLPLELGDMTNVYHGPHSPLNAYGMQTKVAI